MQALEPALKALKNAINDTGSFVFQSGVATSGAAINQRVFSYFIEDSLAKIEENDSVMSTGM